MGQSLECPQPICNRLTPSGSCSCMLVLTFLSLHHSMSLGPSKDLKTLSDGVIEKSKQACRSRSRTALAGYKLAEGIPSFAPFAFTLPKFRFEISEIIG